MKTDTLYCFKMKKFKNFVKNPMIPFHFILNFFSYDHVELVSCKKCAVRITQRPEKNEEMNITRPSIVFVFSNIIEGYKFYSYCTILIRNQHEFVNSFKYNIFYNLGTFIIF